MPLPAVRIAAETADAYSVDRYESWVDVTMLLLNVYREDEVAVILRSKHMRWAADHVSKSSGVTVQEFADYLTNHFGAAEFVSLMAETYRDEWSVEPTHRDCVVCDRCGRDAIGLAKATGSKTGSQTDRNHGAAVVRHPSWVKS